MKNEERKDKGTGKGVRLKGEKVKGLIRLSWGTEEKEGNEK